MLSNQAQIYPLDENSNCMKHNYLFIIQRYFLIWITLSASCSVMAQAIGKLQLNQPTYLCTTGFIIFNTFGGDGTPISYSATGVTLATPSSNTGIVDEARRNNPNSGPIIIQAIQSGDTTYSLAFDIHRYCSPSNAFLLPVLRSPLPDTTLVVGESNPVLNVGKYFRSNNIGYDYRARFSYNAYGIPPGMMFRGHSGLPPGTAGDTASAFITGLPTTVGVYRVAIIATSQGAFTAAYSIADTFKITVLSNRPPMDSPLTLTPPTYDCLTGSFHFNTAGGDSTQIEYYAAPGITGWTTDPNQLVDFETRTAPDAQPITLRARQNGKEVFYIWEIRTVCPVGNSDALRLIAPEYDCGSGAFTFKTTGGDNSLIEFAAIGITGWTLTPNQFVDTETRTAADAPPITLKARQNGQEVTYEWNIRAVCPLGSFRMGVAPEPSEDLQIKVLGNPVFNETLEIEILGAQDQSLQLQLFNEQGNKVSETVISSATSHQRATLRTGSPSGIYLLRVSTPTQRQTVKVIK
ncbi:T9SS type A sorting domain-containing protein [Spirosoma utsteinense]|uniref:T9SS type A sorting domain-containing protein n=1 Tax=Spirosoma utsteinense TaxID=2585773 RepID=A0ABR6W9U9_9BACT|nr:T9SS type A sorting domain-containing protein [Spirosoma utsteinense]MBC3787257.1 hypothetical protein [Spirosoma utsteinense]MBC3792943.1 hypothetical protein [Spirosoma utsteinense]